MPTFLDLPVELQLQIFSEVDLDDIEQFTLCCKATHRHSEERLAEQYARKRSFHTIAIGHIDNQAWDEDKQIRGVHPLVVLRHIVADPQARYYTKTLIIGNIKCYSPNLLGDQEEAELDEFDVRDAATQLKTNSQLFKTALEMSQIVCLNSDTETRLEEILSGDMLAAARLLIPTFPNLEKLRLMDDYLDWSGTQLRKTVEAILLRARSAPDLTGIKPFSKLTEVGMIGTKQDFGADYDVLRGFMDLPSLKSIRGQFVDGADHYTLYEPPWKSSNVTNFDFRQSSIEAATFKRTLCATKGLKSLIYDFRPCSYAGTKLWEPRQTVEALKAHAKQTLSHLELTALTVAYPGTDHSMDYYIDFGQGEPFIGSLSTFEVLETMRLETMMLYKEIKCDICSLRKIHPMLRPRCPGHLVEPERLVDILPVSARRLRLVGGLSREDATAMLEDLPALKDQRLPNLSRIFFEDIQRSDVDEIVIIECEDAGVKMKFWQPLHKGSLGLSKER